MMTPPKTNHLQTNNLEKTSETRVLVLTPTGRDAVLIRATLENAGLSAQICSNLKDLEENIAAGVGAVLLAEEVLDQNLFDHLVELFNRQPVWSDIPVVLLASNTEKSEVLLNSIGTLINITIVERPIHKAILISALRGALRARKRQYQTRDLLAQLEEADRQKDLFLATLSHELRTPLNSMLGWIQLLKSENHNGFDKKHALDVIERNAKAQVEMVGDILLLSRIVTGKFEIERELTSLNAIVRAALDVVQPSLAAKEIRLSLALEELNDSIYGDADRLQQVFWNLLSNAIKFTPVKGQISVRAEQIDSNVTIRIVDSGQGIKPDFLPFVFERFRQADNSYTRSAGGLGLGLAIVRYIVELHNGRVSAESDGEDCGSIFTVSLPLAQLSKEAKESKLKRHMPMTNSNSDSPLKGVRVLLAEDDADSREMLATMFNLHQIETRAVATAIEALEVVGENSVQILISDVGMPDMDGYQLIRQIRQLPPEKGGAIPAIALTGYASSQDRARSLEAGYQAHLAKPIDINELIEAMKKIVLSKQNL